MEPATIAIIDDEQQIVGQLKDYMDQMYKAQEIAIPISVTTYTAVQDFQKGLLENRYDLLIMDIWLGSDVSGFDLAKQAMEINNETQVIFISGYLDYLPTAWEQAAVRFITKPVTYDKLREALTHWQNIIRQQFTPFRFVCDGSQMVLSANQILCIVSRDKALFLIDWEGAARKFKGQIKAIEQQLMPLNYVRCHHSYFINMQHIVNVETDGRCGQAVLGFRNGSTISVPISARKMQEVKAAYNRYLNTGNAY